MTVKAVVFDLGGVLVRLGALDELLGLEMAAEEFWPAWLASEAVRAFEKGEIGPDAFGQGLVAEFGLDLDPAELLANFARFPQGLYPGAEALVAQVRQQATTGMLSNTNALHWNDQVDAEKVRGLVDRPYLSFEVGLVKPDPEIYHHVVDDLDLPASAVLFLDDNQINVEAARSVGMQASRVIGPQQARQAIIEAGLELG